MSLRIKKGVRILGMKTEILFACIIAEGIFAQYGVPCVITEGTEGKHTPHSHHKKGLAVGFRTRMVPAELHEELAERLEKALGDEFQVILHTTHIHVEYDPI
jgi:hypothetical protein